MTTTTKKWTGKKQALPLKAAKARRSAKADAAAEDRAQRKKVGKTLDVAAFMADFQRDTTSAAYWETEE
jgi:hypothetical protein